MARGGLGWGPRDLAIPYGRASAYRQVSQSLQIKGLYGGWGNLFFGTWRWDMAIATSQGPHPNPPLAKGRGPEVELNVRQIPLMVKNLPL
ncbi:MAG: hypothetical protein ACRC8Y_25420 [Chroococcales cyanobacterium]